MNILLTSVGRRAYLVKAFQDALHGHGTVHVCNSSALSVAFHYADRAVVSPLIYDEAYIPFLLSYCKAHAIGLVIPLFDIDLLVLAENKDAFAAIGTRVVVSDPAFVAVCNDKWQTYQFLRAHDFRTPQTYLRLTDVKAALHSGALTYPVIVKPRVGCGSIGVAVAQDARELDCLSYLVEHEIMRTYLKYESAAQAEKILYQERLNGQEYGIDIIHDLCGTFRVAVVKKKLAMRSGETDIAETVAHRGIEAVAKRLGQTTNAIGNVDCDCFDCNGDIYVIEMNARFGGGYPFSHLAGCDLPAALIAWAEGREVPPHVLAARTGVRGCKEIRMTADEGRRDFHDK